MKLISIVVALFGFALGLLFTSDTVFAEPDITQSITTETEQEIIDPVASIEMSVGYEHSVRHLPKFNDTFISRSDGRQYIETKPKVSTNTIAASIGLDFGSFSTPHLPRRWRLEGKLSEGDATHKTLTTTEPIGATATVSLDGLYLEPGKFVPSQYTTTLSIDEVSGEFHMLGEVLRSPMPNISNNAVLSLSLGPMASFRKQDVDVDYIATLDYFLGPAFANSKAVHFIREDLDIKSGGVTLDGKLDIDLNHGLEATMGLRASAYMQDIHFSGIDCLSNAFSLTGTCDGRHHTINSTGEVYYSPVDQKTKMLGAYLRLSGGLTQTVNLDHSIKTTIHAGGFIEAWLNDPAIDNPNFDNPHPARVKYGTTVGYGWTAQASLHF